MKYIKSYIFLTLMVVSLVGCKVDDLKDDVNDLKDRVTLIEEQVKLLNDNVEVLAYVLDPQQKTIKSVTENNGQYVITLSDGSVMTLTIGQPGTIVQPEISVDNNGYWVVNGNPTGVKAVGEDGKNGEGYPEFRVEEGKWQVRFGESGWSDVPGGDLGTGSLGDQFFESASLSEDGTVFTIVGTEGQVYTFPVVASLVCEINGNETVVEFDYDSVQEFDVKISGGEPLAPIYPAGWRAELTKKEAVGTDEYNYTLIVYAPVGSKAMADNTSEIVVRVNQGTLWAVDKLQVELK